MIDINLSTHNVRVEVRISFMLHYISTCYILATIRRQTKHNKVVLSTYGVVRKTHAILHMKM